MGLFINTRAGLKKIQRELSLMVSILGIIGMILFATYYIYLIVKNFNNILYLVIYSLLFLVILSTFILHITIKQNPQDNKKSNRLVSEKKKHITRIIKIIKYFAKATLVTVAIFETFSDLSLNISNIINISSLVFLVLQILIELVIHYILHYIEYFSVAIRMDLDNHRVLKGLFIGREGIFEEFSYTIAGENKYTDKEEIRKKEIESQSKEFIQDKKEKNEQIIVSSKKRISLALKGKFKRLITKNKK